MMRGMRAFWGLWYLAGVVLTALGCVIVMMAGHNDSVARLGYALLPGAWLATLLQPLLPGDGYGTALALTTTAVLGQVAAWHALGMGLRRVRLGSARRFP